MQRSPIKSASRTLEILELFQERRTPLRLTYIFESLGYPQSSTTTLLKSLVVLGYLNFDRSSRTYFPTPRVSALGDWINHYIYGAGDLLSMIESLRDQSDETVAVSSQNDIFVQHIRIRQPGHDFKMPPPEGSMRVLTQSAPGLVLLSRMTPKALDKLVRHIGIFEGVKVDLEQLNDQLQLIRRDGYCLLAGYPIPEAAALSIPLPLAPHGMPLAVGVGGLNSRITRRKTELVGILRACVAQYEAKLKAAATEEALRQPVSAIDVSGAPSG